MKKLFLLGVLATSLSYAQVTDQNGVSADGSGNTNLTGNIGVGITPSSSSPYKLDVNGQGRYSGNLLIGEPNGARTEINTNLNHKIYNAAGKKTIDIDGNFQGGGYLGVYRGDNQSSTVAMHSRLDLNMQYLRVEKFTLDGSYQEGAKLISILDSGDSEALTGLQINTTNAAVVIGDRIEYEKNKGFGLVNRFKTKLENDVYLETGNLGIGTYSFIDNGTTYKLSVNGAVRAHSVKVYTDWADYVFEPDYKLPSLAEVENFIIQNGHLKDIPSANEVEEKGIELGEMNKLLLQKIEELTLYTIELKKELDILKMKIDKNEN